MKIRHRTDYRQHRVAEYPTAGDLADALYHKERGNEGPWREYVARVDAVKRRFPKPKDAQ